MRADVSLKEAKGLKRSFYRFFISAARISHGALMQSACNVPAELADFRDVRLQMLDALMVILGTGAFALLLGYVAVCDRL